MLPYTFKFGKLFTSVSQNAFSRFQEYKKGVLIWNLLSTFNPASIYLFQVKKRNSRKSSDKCSKLAIKTPEASHWRSSGVFIVNFEHISHLFLVSFWIIFIWGWKVFYQNCCKIRCVNYARMRVFSQPYFAV